MPDVSLTSAALLLMLLEVFPPLFSGLGVYGHSFNILVLIVFLLDQRESLLDFPFSPVGV